MSKFEQMMIVSTKDNIMLITFIYQLELGLVIVNVYHHLRQHDQSMQPKE